MRRIALLLVVLFIAGCGGGGGGGGDTSAPPVYTHMTATLDGFPFTATKVASFSFASLPDGRQHIGASAFDDGTGLVGIIIGAPIPALIPATTALGTSETAGVAIYATHPPLTTWAESGSVTITYYSPSRIVGTFRFHAHTTTGEIVTVENGSFDLPRLYR